MALANYISFKGTFHHKQCRISDDSFNQMLLPFKVYCKNKQLKTEDYEWDFTEQAVATVGGARSQTLLGFGVCTF